MPATTPHDDSLAIALAQAALGREVFPTKGKLPLVRWQQRSQASADPERVRRLWKAHPDADGAAWRIERGLVVLDVDRPEDFHRLVPSLPDAPSQRTTRGAHHLYRDPGAVQGAIRNAGADLKVGGKGYVRLYSADAFDGELTADLPAEVVRLRGERRGLAADADEPMGTRDEILSFAGRLRRAGADSADIQAALAARLADGRIVDLDESNPWNEGHLRAIARDIGSKPVGDEIAYEAFARDALAGLDAWKRRRDSNERTGDGLVTVSARELLAREFRPMIEPVPGLVVEGLGMLIGGPKKGKSWLAYQFAVAIATGDEVLGQRALKGDVLYLALEDGERRAQDRIRIVLRHMGQDRLPRDAAELEIGFNAERGEALVAQVEEFLSRRPGTRLVIVDTLQKIRPASSGRRGQYELDAEDIGRVQAITQRHPGLAILLVHHDRKEAVTDFLDAASGTHGITGSIDTGLLLRRDRHATQGTLEVTGRDVREDLIYLAYDEKSPFWEIDPAGGLTEQQREAWEWLRGNGPSTPSEVADTLGIDRRNAGKMLGKLVDRRILTTKGGKYSLPFPMKSSISPDDMDDGDDGDDVDDGDDE